MAHGVYRYHLSSDHKLMANANSDIGKRVDIIHESLMDIDDRVLDLCDDFSVIDSCVYQLFDFTRT